MRTFSFLDKSFWTNNERGFRKCPALVPGFYAGPRGWCLKASPAGARTGDHAPVFVDRSLRPNGPGDSSPGLRPEADALGKGAPPSLRPERPREPGSIPLVRGERTDRHVVSVRISQ